MFVSSPEVQIIGQIAKRAADLAKNQGLTQLSSSCRWSEFAVDILKFHENMPMRLQDLLEADDIDFAYDVFGIHESFTLGNKTLKERSSVLNLARYLYFFSYYIERKM